ncbi:polysialyltransferase family glycosyltransferase [Halomonas salipaludis]|uniref:polysialyltransferase family glycosyltransferase n=1 Tax=Halomonas salipaludis TaxID=2032625 RepID=UPI001140AE83|nr:polysialyltransferase family glycosyltransferase [Halomonas salipaludis]
MNTLVSADKDISLFICISPLHILNSIEVVKHWRINPESCVLLLLPRIDNHRDRLEQVIGLLEWGEIIYIENDPRHEQDIGFWQGIESAKSQYLSMRKWRKKIIAWKRCSFLCMPYLNNFMMKRLHAWLRPNSLVLIDDGTLTERVLYKKRNYLEYDPVEDYVYESSDDIESERSKEKFYFTLYGVVHILSGLLMRPPYSHEYILFSQYSNMAPIGFSGVKNSYTWLSSQENKDYTISDVVHFLGAPLVERDGIPLEDYVEWLEKVKTFYPNLDICYLLHPAESDEFGEKIRESLHFTVMRKNLPYEFSFAISNERPSVVASWFCSALEYVSKNSDVKVDAYRFNLEKYSSTPALSSAKMFYKRYAKGGQYNINVIDL